DFSDRNVHSIHIISHDIILKRSRLYFLECLSQVSSSCFCYIVKDISKWILIELADLSIVIMKKNIIIDARRLLSKARNKSISNCGLIIRLVNYAY
ncbi:MAG TPA: hypothetical protein VH500_07050, partial [Nitrososphaeraceae archaeon]